MKYHMIEVRMLEDNKIGLYDMSQLMYKSKLKAKYWRGMPLEEIVGKDHTVYVLDPDEEFTRKQCINLALKFLMGDYEVYSLVSGEFSRGNRLMR